jgi:hypothetical protein
MARIGLASLEAFLAFGNASIAISEVRELARRRQGDGGSADDLLVELRSPRTAPGALRPRTR